MVRRVSTDVQGGRTRWSFRLGRRIVRPGYVLVTVHLRSIRRSAYTYVVGNALADHKT
jgi:hypothetical protein